MDSTPADDPSPISSWLEGLRDRTPARILAGRTGTAYRTKDQLALRCDHAAAIDAVHAEVDLDRDFAEAFQEQFRLFEVSTCARSKQEHLLRPDRGRQLSSHACKLIQSHCPRGADVQVAIGDGLSATAVRVQVPPLLPLLEEQVTTRGWSFGQPFFIRHCRVGVMNDLGAILDPTVVVLLIGERPGLATAESLSAYLAYRPRPGDTDANRNLISNIHVNGIGHGEAASRIVALAATMRSLQTSGTAVKENLRVMDLPRGQTAFGPAPDSQPS